MASVTSLDMLANLANIDSASLSPDLTLDELASAYSLNGRAALIAKLRSSGLAAGHAGKLANAMAKCVREGRIAVITMPEAAPSADLDLRLRFSMRSVCASKNVFFDAYEEYNEKNISTPVSIFNLNSCSMQTAPLCNLPSSLYVLRCCGMP